MHWIIIAEAVLAGGLGLWALALRAQARAAHAERNTEAARLRAAEAEIARHAAHEASLVEQLEAERSRSAAVRGVDAGTVEQLLADLARCKDAGAALARARRLLGHAVQP